MRQIIFTIIFISLPVIWNAYRDSERINKGVRIPTRQKDIRSALWVVVIVIMTILIQAYWFSRVDGLITFLMCAHFQAIKWMVFDLALNRFRGKKWDYISDNARDDDDAASDTIFHIFPDEKSGKIQFMFKLLWIVGSGIGMYYQGLYSL